MRQYVICNYGTGLLVDVSLKVIYMPHVAIFSPLRLSLKSLSLLLGTFDHITVVFEAESEQELLGKLALNEIDILLIDVQKPITLQHQISNKIKSSYPEIKTLIITQKPMNQMQVINWGANGYITRNSEPELLAEGINKVSIGEMYLEHDLGEVIFTVLSNQTNNKKPSNAKLLFSRREMEIIKLTSKQFQVDDIARKLYITRRTVEGHKSRILEKTSSKNFIGAILFALKAGVLSLEEL